MFVQAWTDYPIEALGDAQYQPAPIRLCRVLAYDGDKYCVIRIGALTVPGIKRCYLYKQRGRAREVPVLSARQLNKLATDPIRDPESKATS